jgi:uncharacterized coiled-coil protein SlyX
LPNITALEIEFRNTEGLYKSNVISKQELESIKSRLDKGLRDRRLLELEFEATVKDLKLQIAEADSEIKTASAKLDILNAQFQNATVSYKELIDGQSAIKRATVTKERLESRLNYLLQAGKIAGLGDDQGKQTNSSDSKSSTVKVLIATDKIEAGAKLDTSNTEFIDWQTTTAPEGRIGPEMKYLGQTVKESVPLRKPIVTSNLMSNGSASTDDPPKQSE